MKKALALVLTITMLFAFCTGMAEGWTAIEPNTGGESTQAEGGTGGEGAFTADDGYTEPEKIYGEGDENYESEVPEELRHLYLEEQSRISTYANDVRDVRKVRVLISQKNHSESTVRIYGNYAVHDAAGNALFIAQDEAAYTVKAENSAVSLYSAFGTLLYSGASVSFKEFAGDDANNCVKVSSVSMGSDVTDRTYRGDMEVYYFAKSGNYDSYWNGLYVVNEVYIEDYLEGVVAAEVGAGYRDAAQQAQAIVSRAFAIQSSSKKRVFDMRDTSASQAYFGMTDICRAAVQATAGQTLYYYGDYLRVHFGGTNGGETEITNNQWSGYEFCGEESVREDAYDLASTSKYVETVTIPASPSGSETYVQSLITNALIPALNSAGYSVTAATVSGISMETRCDNTACRHHHRSTAAGQVCNHFCSVDITFTGINATGAGYIDSFTVNLTENDFFIKPNNGRPLGFFSKGSCSRYWLIKNYTGNTVTSYTIRHARYGGGVGLSQYGADYRAAKGQNVSDILAFHYPNSTIAPLAADISRPAIQAKPSVKYDARVLGSDARVFAKKNSAADAIATIQAGNTVFVNEISGKWAHVSCGGVSGYIAASTLERTAVQVTPANVDSSTNVRKEADSTSAKVYTAKKGENYTLIEANAAPGWHKINTPDGVGYITARYSTLIFQGSGEQFDEPTGLEGSLSYYGAAIKLSGDYGIRVRFGIDIAAHDGGTIAGYTIKEYGVIADGEKQRAYYTENGAKYDKVSAVADGMALFAANIDNIAALKAEHSFRPYIIAENAKGEITHYGDEVKLSVYSVAIKLADEYAADSAEGQYIAALIAQANAE